MSITTETNRIEFVGDGSDNSPYAISIPLRDDDSVEVIYVTDSTGAEVVKTKTTDYTIAVAADFASATLTLVTTAPATGETMLIRRNEPATRLSNYSNFDGQPSATTNSDYDKGTMADQTLQEQLDRAIVVSKGHPDTNLPLTPLTLKGNGTFIVTVKTDETDFELLANGIADGTITPAQLLDGTVDNQVIQYNSGLGEWEYRSDLTIDGDIDVTGDIDVFEGRIGVSHTVSPLYLLHDTGATADEGIWLIVAQDEEFSIRTLSDDALSGNEMLTFIRSGVTGVRVDVGSDLAVSGDLGVGGVIATSSLVNIEGSISFKEQAAADGDTAAYGQTWVRDDGPNVYVFTDDEGTDFVIGGAGGASGSGTLNTIPLWTPDGDTLGDSVITQSGIAVTLVGVLDVAGGAASWIKVSHADSPFYELDETSATADEGRWLVAAEDDKFSIRTLSDDDLSGNEMITLIRSGVTSVRIDLSSDIDVSGTITAGSGNNQITTAAGLLRHQVIDPAIAGAGLTATTGVLSVDAHAPAAHTIASHSDTTATGAELETLTDNSMADALHRHSELSASDGTPDAILSLDASGNVVIGAVTLTVNSDANGLTILGHAKIGSLSGDIAAFSHFDHQSLTGAGLIQHAPGTTNVGAPTGQNVNLTINGGAELTVDATDVTIPNNDLTLTAGDLAVTAGVVSIGIASGDGTLHVHTASAGAVAASGSADDLVIENSASAGLSILTPGGAFDANIFLGEPANSSIGRIQYLFDDASGGLMRFTVETVVALAIDGNSDVTIPAGGLGVGNVPTITLDVNAKSGHTAEGGVAIKLTNKTGGNSVAGQLVMASAGTADAFDTAPASSDEVIGIVYNAGVADGSEVWVVVSGIVDVLIDAVGVALGDRLVSSATAGSAHADNAPAVAVHFQEIGHCIEAIGGAGVTRCIVHFN